MMLTPHQQAILQDAAKPIAPQLRKAFLEAVNRRLEGMGEIGDGTVARACREFQGKYLDPPSLQGRPNSRWWPTRG
jgi:hypothetical protein